MEMEIEDEDINNNTIDEKDCWKVASAYFKKYGLVSQQINSFNHFIKQNIKKIIHENNIIIIKPDIKYNKSVDNQINKSYEIKFDKATIEDYPHILENNNENKLLFPHEARIRNIDYSSKLYVDIIWREKNNNEIINEQTFSSINIGKIPIMVRSKYCSLNYNINKNNKNEEIFKKLKESECEYDQGGYFIIGGGEKVIIAQERMATNFVYVSKKSDQSSSFYQAEIRSSQEGSNYPPHLFSVKIMKKKNFKLLNEILITAKIHYVNEEIPISILFGALGIQSDKDIMEHIIFDEKDLKNQFQELIRNSLESKIIREKNKCLEYIGKRIFKNQQKTSEEYIERAELILNKYLLPHISTKQGDENKKAYFIGYMLYRCGSCFLGRQVEDDRDHFGKKRLDTSGVLLASLFRQVYNQFKTKVQSFLKIELKKCKNNEIDITKIIDINIITKGMKRALATGNWGNDKKGLPLKAGVAQSLQRLTFLSTLSHLRRVNNHLDKTANIIKPRQLHSTHWGMLCPAETPEGKECGLVKNLALMTQITVETPGKIIKDILNNIRDFEELDSDNSNIKGKSNISKIFINGAWVGNTLNPESIKDTLLCYRKNGIISREISIVSNYLNNEIKIFTDGGRTIRPLFTVQKFDKKLKKQELNLKKKDIQKIDVSRENPEDFDYLIKEGKIEYLDVEEEESSMIAMKIDDLNKNYCFTYTHCEIHPAMILGVSASIIPFPDHNQSPRNVYQSAMGKQAIGIYSTNFNIRMDTLSHILFYPQEPLVFTKSMEYLKFREMPAGINAIVAIMCYTGYNQEDSIIMNQSSIDRGLFRSAFCRTYESQEKIDPGKKKEIFGIPTNISKGKDKIDGDGLISPGKSVSGNDIIIGKKLININNNKEEDASTKIKKTEKGFIDSVMMTMDGEGYRMAKVKCRNIRIPQIGDKFASRHGQKGTIGMTYRQEDLPFNIEGITPDIIVNPHAIPSRMTIGHLIECLSSKVSSIFGEKSDSTPFSNITVDEISSSLHKLGYQKYGNEALFNGFTGRKFDMLIFFGPTYYQKLKHMVEDKIFSRSIGPIQILTRQPTEGRAKDGGLRFGEMERDCAISHGAAAFLKERLFDLSDKYRVHVCERCGLIASANLNTQKFKCLLCKNTDRIYQVYLPYSCKLLFQELMAMHIKPKLELEDPK